MRSTTVLCSYLLLGLASCSVGAEGPPAARYTIKQYEPDTGTNIRRNVVTGGVLPFDKRYAELTPQQQATIKSWYEQLGPDDEPPFPAEGLAPIYKAIAAGHEKLPVQGKLALAVEVDGQGQPVSVAVLQSVDSQMDRFVASVLMLQRYKPALCNARPCTMQFPFRMVLGTRLP